MRRVEYHKIVFAQTNGCVIKISEITNLIWIYCYFSITVGKCTTPLVYEIDHVLCCFFVKIKAFPSAAGVEDISMSEIFFSHTARPLKMEFLPVFTHEKAPIFR